MHNIFGFKYIANSKYGQYSFYYNPRTGRLQYIFRYWRLPKYGRYTFLYDASRSLYVESSGIMLNKSKDNSFQAIETMAFDKNIRTGYDTVDVLRMGLLDGRGLYIDPRDDAEILDIHEAREIKSSDIIKTLLQDYRDFSLGGGSLLKDFKGTATKEIETVSHQGNFDLDELTFNLKSDKTLLENSKKIFSLREEKARLERYRVDGMLLDEDKMFSTENMSFLKEDSESLLERKKNYNANIAETEKKSTFDQRALNHMNIEEVEFLDAGDSLVKIENEGKLNLFDFPVPIDLTEEDKRSATELKKEDGVLDTIAELGSNIRKKAMSLEFMDDIDIKNKEKSIKTDREEEGAVDVKITPKSFGIYIEDYHDIYHINNKKKKLAIDPLPLSTSKKQKVADHIKEDELSNKLQKQEKKILVDSRTKNTKGKSKDIGIASDEDGFVKTEEKMNISKDIDKITKQNKELDIEKRISHIEKEEKELHKQLDKRLSLHKRFWFLKHIGETDIKILPNRDFPYPLSIDILEEKPNGTYFYKYSEKLKDLGSYLIRLYNEDLFILGQHNILSISNYEDTVDDIELKIRVDEIEESDFKYEVHFEISILKDNVDYISIRQPKGLLGNEFVFLATEKFISEKHPIPIGEDLGLREIPIAIPIMVDFINIILLLWSKRYLGFSGTTGSQAIVKLTKLVHQWVTLDTSLEEEAIEDYHRCYRWMRWEAEKVYNKAKLDPSLNGNYWIEQVVFEMIDYMEMHHFNNMPEWDKGVYGMDEHRNIFNDPQLDIPIVLDKFKGIRKRALEKNKRLND